MKISCLCGHGESCQYCSFIAPPTKDKRVDELEEVLRKISATALDTMGLRWIRKQVSNALGEADD